MGCPTYFITYMISLPWGYQGTQCQINCDIIHSICELLGVPLAKDNGKGLCTLLEYLGFLLDAIKMTVYITTKREAE